MLSVSLIKNLFFRLLIKYIKKSKPDILFSCYQGIIEGPLLWARLVKLFYPRLKVISGYRNCVFFKCFSCDVEIFPKKGRGLPKMDHVA